jgi:hypothetical protein
VADKKSKANPYQWPNGSWHSIPWSQQEKRTQGTVGLDGKPVTQTQWENGDLLASMLGNDPVKIARAYGDNPIPGIRDAHGQPVTGTGYLQGQIVTAAGGSLAGSSIPGAPPIPGTPQPVDPALEEQRLIANRNIALGNGEAAYQQGNLGFDYGYNPNGTINTANPYSRAAMLQLGYEHQQAGTTNSYAAQGQLYSGAIQNALGEGSRQYGANEAANRLAYQRATHGIQAGQLGTVANAGTGVSNADFQALLKATYPGG